MNIAMDTTKVVIPGYDLIEQLYAGSKSIIIDFSTASLLPKETTKIKNPNVLAGTLAYLAPEQSGRMKQGIDYRADFYALGITFLELLTVKLPF